MGSPNNEIDHSHVHPLTVHVSDSERPCPRCKIIMQTIDLKIDGEFLIERCEKCMGLFFDTGELEDLIKASMDQGNPEIDELNKTHHTKRPHTAYVPCPVCSGIMHRVNFGTRSGVIIDRCHMHGMWLDGGELGQLLEWVKAGGELLSKQTNGSIQKQTTQKKKGRPGKGNESSMAFDQYGRSLKDQDPDIFSILNRVIRWFVS